MDTQNLISAGGMVVLLVIAWLLSSNRKLIRWRIVFWGITLQLGFAVFILTDWPFYYFGMESPGKAIFMWFNGIIVGLLSFTLKGSEFVFGSLVNYATPVISPNGETIGSALNLGYFAFNVLPTIIFFSSLMTVLYHLGVMQRIVLVFAKVMKYFMGTSGAETLSASANIFVGQTEAPLVVKPYVDKMTMSELMCVMTGGMATVAGGVMAAYVGMLHGYFPTIAGHLLSASILSAPAALVMAKIMVPETGIPETAGEVKLQMEKTDANVIGAAASGAGQGMTLAINVAAMLIAFIALIALLDFVLGWGGDTIDRYVRGIDDHAVSSASVDFMGSGVAVGDQVHIGQGDAATAMTITGIIDSHNLEIDSKVPATSAGKVFTITSPDGVARTQGADLAMDQGWEFSMTVLFGYIFWPFAFIMGVPKDDCTIIGVLLGEKLALNEFVAYSDFASRLASGVKLSPRAVVIATYALCGFSNFSSIAIQIGGIGGIAPKRKNDLAKLGIKSVIAGSLACFMTAAVAGVFFDADNNNSILTLPEPNAASAASSAPDEGVLQGGECANGVCVIVSDTNLPAASDLPMPPLEPEP